jgi:hypothetical protein
MHARAGYDIDTNHERAAPWLAELVLGPKEKETPDLVENGAIKAFNASHPVGNFLDKLIKMWQLSNNAMYQLSNNATPTAPNLNHAKIVQHGIPIVF